MVANNALANTGIVSQRIAAINAVTDKKTFTPHYIQGTAPRHTAKHSYSVVNSIHTTVYVPEKPVTHHIPRDPSKFENRLKTHHHSSTNHNTVGLKIPVDPTTVSQPKRREPSTPIHQYAAQFIVDNMSSKEKNAETGGHLGPLKACFKGIRLHKNQFSIADTKKLNDELNSHGPDFSDNHVLDCLDSYLVRGAHIAFQDNGILFKATLSALTGRDFDTPEQARDVLWGDRKFLAEVGMVARNSSLFTLSSHYKAWPKQFGIDIANGGHLLMGLRINAQGKIETWLQLESHGLSTISDFKNHGIAFLFSRGYQIGKDGSCPFTENDNIELTVSQNDEKHIDSEFFHSGVKAPAAGFSDPFVYPRAITVSN